MSREQIEREFRVIGVRLHLEGEWSHFAIGVSRDRPGERITLSPGKASVQVIDVDRGHAQLLLLVRTADPGRRWATQKILCGRDERSLFAVRVPVRFGATVNSVTAAHEALKPEELRAAGPRTGRRSGRRGPAFVRQGDWFFVSRPHLPHDLLGARKRVRLNRGSGNSHVVDLLCGDERQFYSWFGRGVRPGPVFARGFVRHHEHRPIRLRCWHQVFPNAALGQSGGFDD